MASMLAADSDSGRKKRWLILGTDQLKSDYEIGKVLGTGGFSVVREATNKKTRQTFALKIIDKTNVKEDMDNLQSEIQILQEVSHRNVVNLFRLYESPNRVYLLMEKLSGGELFDRIVTDYPEGYSEKDAARILTDIVKGVQYLHSKGIVHRDLKPENLMYTSQDPVSTIKITDFGLAKIMDPKTMLTNACGTPNYVAPEILRQKGYGPKVDMWSVGVILYILLCGYPPFADDDEGRLFRNILKGKFEFPKDDWTKVSKSAKELITKLLEIRPEKRLSPEEVLAHPWIRGLATNDVRLASVVQEMRRMNARRKFAIATDALIAATRMATMMEGLTDMQRAMKDHRL